MAVAPSVVTTPDTFPPPPLRLKVLVFKVVPFISKEKVADTVVLTATPVAPLDGLTERTVNVTPAPPPPPPSPPPPEGAAPQLELPPISVQLLGLMRALPILLESFTST